MAGLRASLQAGVVAMSQVGEGASRALVCFL